MKTNTCLAGLALAAFALGAGPAGGQQPSARLTAMPGYLSGGTAPSSLTLVPPPPAAGSAAQARDTEAAAAAVALHGGPRWELATQDADLSFPAAPGTFSCAIGAPITEADTPKLYGLLRKTLVDAGLSTYPTKTRYQRARPFTVNNKPICTPASEAGLRKDGSYPSGHAAVGWAWALILVEVAPDRADPILARGRAFTRSRMVCNVHWQSDVEEGRTMGAAVVARLHDSAEFRTDLAAARAEIAAVRARGLPPSRDCAVETARMAPDMAP